jgi:acetoin utilization deacetylase AcuC-like enzyme
LAVIEKEFAGRKGFRSLVVLRPLGVTAVIGQVFSSEVASAPTSRRQFLRTIAVGLGASVALGETAFAMSTSDPRTPSDRLPTALVYDEVNRFHVASKAKPECPERYDVVLQALKKSDFFSSLRPYQARAATEKEILACHSDKYLARVRQEIKSGAKRLSTGDTWICPESLRAAAYACGAACVAVDAVLDGKADNSFCVARPPGHHATPNRGMGFCIFNNAGIAARYAQRKRRVGKVLIVDWDVHHGNGTQEIFYDDPSVFYFSTHQSPWYPGTGTADETGKGKGLGTTLNCPLKRGAGRKQFMAAFRDKLAPAVSRFKPELVILSAGFDSRHGDPLGRLELTDQDFRDLTGLMLEMARQNANGRVVSILEGGYNLAGLGKATAAHVERLAQG